MGWVGGWQGRQEGMGCADLWGHQEGGAHQFGVGQVEVKGPQMGRGLSLDVSALISRGDWWEVGAEDPQADPTRPSLLSGPWP